MMNLWTWLKYQKERPIPADTEAFDVSNVLEFFWMHEQVWWDFRNDYPNLAPPFRNYFMFGRVPISTRVGSEVRTRDPRECGELGVLFQSGRGSAGGFHVAAWFCGGNAWREPVYAWRVTHDGGFLCLTEEAEARKKGPGMTLFSTGWDAVGVGADDAERLNEFQLLLHPFLLATTFLHCRNVTARRVSVSRQARRSAERENRALFSWSVLDIAPIRSVLATEGRSESEGLKRALHVCRGHFKDYREGQGLFGRHRGLYWWEQSVRGEGPAIHDKTYRVQTKG